MRGPRERRDTTSHGESAVVAAHGTAPRLGWLTPESTATSLVVDYDGNALGPLHARSAIVLDKAALAHAVATRQAVTLVFEKGDARFPIAIGLVQEPPSPLAQLLGAKAPRPAPVEASLDGRRVTLTADREIVLRCGEASLTLQRDGKVVIRGTYVETHAAGTNRIKGGQVKIN
jgi:hypothetical protein